MRKLLYFLIGLLIIVLFHNVHIIADGMRLHSGIGGEIAILFIPVVIWVFYRNIKDGVYNG